MKYIIIILFLASFGLIISGIVTDLDYSQRLIGFGVMGLFFIVFPLFSYVRWKDKDIKDYMLTKENLDKMRENQRNRGEKY